MLGCGYVTRSHTHIPCQRRDGSVITELPIRNLGEYAVGFHRKGDAPDIADFVLTNTDPQGLAIDNIRFNPPPNFS